MAELTVPQIDFSALGQLPALYKQGQADNLRQQTLASLGQGGQVDATSLLKSGDLSLAQLGISMQQRQAEATRQAQLDARQASNDQFSHGIQSAQLELSKRAAARADEGPVEQAGYRAQVAQKYGIDPTTPEGRAFVVSGKLPDTLATGGEVATASQRAQVAGSYGIEKGTPEFKTYVLTGKLPDSVGNGGQPEVGLQPAYGVGPDGKVGAIQFSKTGKALQTQLPEGFSLSKEPIKVDLGTHIQLIDPITRQPIGSPIQKDIAGAATQKVIGTETGKAQMGLPQAVATAEQTLKSIEDVRTHPGRNMLTTGAMGWAPGIPGTEGKGFTTALDQLKGKTFLEAFNSLRGGGQITEAEGSKATAALARLDRAQNSKDFESGLNDLRDVVKTGLQRARAKAGQPSPTPSQGNGADTMLQHARDAIAAGAPREAVLQRLQGAGIDPSGL